MYTSLAIETIAWRNRPSSTLHNQEIQDLLTDKLYNMSAWTRIRDAVLTSKWNKPFPVTMIPSAIGLYMAEKQSERQRQILAEIRALGVNDIDAVKEIASKPR
ncbi:hypothetical protein D6C86_07767 [Aureobasidium pullulans]|nr:hypothetical protein D6C86_07767 [Aureobasidium pullulans]THZ75909.1 hypothetical protein D6C88_06929 [Aureobasidium pullulans]